MKLPHIARGAPPLRLTHITLLLIGTTAILLAFTACGLGVSDEPLEKDPPAGRVLELGTNRPIPGALVYLQKCEPVPFGNLNCVRIDTVISGSDGAYAFPITGFKVNAVKEGYFSGEDYFEYVEAGTESTTDIVLTPYAWIRVTLKNESGLYGFGSSQILDLPSYWIHQEMGDSKTVVKQVKGNQEYKLIFYLLQDENTTTRDISTLVITGEGLGALPIDTSGALDIKIVPVGHDTTDITIIY